MGRSRVRIATWIPCLVAALGALGAQPAGAFLPDSDLLVVRPAFARAGETVEVTVSGTNLDDVETLRFADSRIKVQPVMLPADTFHPEPRPAPNRFEVALPESLPPGVYEVRSLGYFGLSTGRPFLVLPQDAAQFSEEGDHSTPATALEVAVNGGVLGHFDNRKIDWYRFTAKKGQRLFLQLKAERLDSKADALLAVFDASGAELENSRLHYGRDPFVDFTAPEDGEYRVAVADVLYRGGTEYFYRLEIADRAQLDFAFPPAAAPGTEASLTLFGRNLPGGKATKERSLDGKFLQAKSVKVQVPSEPEILPGIFHGTPRQGLLPAFLHREGNSNALRIGFATAPVVIETSGEALQAVSPPCEVAGRFEVGGDFDTFRFQGKKGRTYWVEAISERLGVPVDPYVVVEKVTRGEDGEENRKTVAENDDPPSFYAADAFDDLNVDTLDSRLSFTADEDAEYRVVLSNQRGGGSAAHLYRLAIRDARPGFQLLAGKERTKIINNDAYPAAPLLRQGGSMVYRIIALRRDGFAGDITVRAEDLPPGVSAKPLVLSGTTDQGFLTLRAAEDAKAWHGSIRLAGVARVGDKELRRQARSASILWGQRVFANATQVRSRLDEEVVLSVIETEKEPASIQPAEDKVWTVELNQDLEIPIKVTDRGTRKGNLQIEPHGFPGLLRGRPKISIAEGEHEGVLKVPLKPTGNFKITPGRYQFVLQGIGNADYEHNPGAAERAAAEHKRLEALTKTLEGKIAEAKKQADAATKALEEMKKKVAGAADDSARAQLDEALKAAENKKAESDQAAKAAEEAAKRAKSLTDAAAKQAKTLTDKAKAKRSQFAAYSMPITVEVVAPPKPEKK